MGSIATEALPHHRKLFPDDSNIGAIFKRRFHSEENGKLTIRNALQPSTYKTVGKSTLLDPTLNKYSESQNLTDSKGDLGITQIRVVRNAGNDQVKQSNTKNVHKSEEDKLVVEAAQKKCHLYKGTLKKGKNSKTGKTRNDKTKRKGVTNHPAFRTSKPQWTEEVCDCSKIDCPKTSGVPKTSVKKTGTLKSESHKGKSAQAGSDQRNTEKVQWPTRSTLLSKCRAWFSQAKSHSSHPSNVEVAAVRGSKGRLSNHTNPSRNVISTTPGRNKTGNKTSETSTEETEIVSEPREKGKSRNSTDILSFHEKPSTRPSARKSNSRNLKQESSTQRTFFNEEARENLRTVKFPELGSNKLQITPELTEEEEVAFPLRRSARDPIEFYRREKADLEHSQPVHPWNSRVEEDFDD